jgi:protein-S-isoprenylcysteine O-methyltransferase Ste14
MTALNGLKTLIFTMVVPGAVAGFIPYLLLASGGPLHVPAVVGPWLLGIIPMALGIAIYLWCAWDFIAVGRGTPAPIDAPKQLVVRGLYHFVRNPMYIGVTLVIAGEAIVFSSVPLAVYTAFVFAAFHLAVVLYEEPTLQGTFGEDYKQYCDAVPRWLPRLSGGRGGSAGSP